MSEVAAAFFAAMARRDVAGIKALLAPGFIMTVSGNHRFTDIEAFFAYSRTRQGAVRKQIAGYDVSQTGGTITVYAHGTMSGTWLDGSPYEQVRFVDRFEIQQGQISKLDVFSDMAEFRPST